jgi:hypothetical protein
VGHCYRLQLGHNLSVASQLDEVADRLAQQSLDLKHCCPGVLVRAQDDEGFSEPVPACRWGVDGRVGPPPIPATARSVDTRRLYEQVTGVDRDRANADLALVADRLSP